MTVELTVCGSEIRAKDRILASGAGGTARARFFFDGSWDGFVKTAVFFREADKPCRVLLEGDAALLPAALLAEPGRLYAGVFGTKGEKTATSSLAVLEVARGAADGGLPPEPEASVYAQLADAVEKTRRETADLAAALRRETAAFEARLSAGEETRKTNEARREQAEAERAAAFEEGRIVPRALFEALVGALEDALGVRLRFERTERGEVLCLTETKNKGERI